ncbi:MAG: hypothetical protein KJ737_09080 [Proteobacteria bacterium]|nr:hypothetical protein [Pseudomonadota bacterium]
MAKDIREKIKKFLVEKNIPVFGVAPAEILNDKAPEGFRPKDMIKTAKSVLVLGKPLPIGVFHTPKPMKNKFYTQAFSTYYKSMNDVTNSIALMLEDEGFLSLPVPAYSPITFHDGEPRGLLSLKHAAVEAGIGIMGKNSLLIHPQLGNVLRFGGLLTTMDWQEEKPPIEEDLCPADCHKCEKVCPVSAIDNGNINKMKCMGHCISHTLIPPKMLLPSMKWVLKKSRMLSDFMDMFVYNFFESYGIDCVACLKACPRFPRI